MGLMNLAHGLCTDIIIFSSMHISPIEIVIVDDLKYLCRVYIPSKVQKQESLATLGVATAVVATAVVSWFWCITTEKIIHAQKQFYCKKENWIKSNDFNSARAYLDFTKRKFNLKFDSMEILVYEPNILWVLCCNLHQIWSNLSLSLSLSLHTQRSAPAIITRPKHRIADHFCMLRSHQYFSWFI